MTAPAGTAPKLATLRPGPDGFSYLYAALPPQARIVPGQTLEVFTEDCFGGRLTTVDGRPREVAPFPRVNPLTGPIAVEGCRPGDLLAIHLASVEPARDWGVATVSPNFGALSGTRLGPNLQPEQDEHVWIWRVDAARRTVSTETTGGRRLEVPLRPFHGSLGVAPAHGETRLSVVPDAFGGNMDVPDLRAGTTLYLRANFEGGLIWIGDGHYVQGDGEIAGTAVEGALTTRLVADLLPASSPDAADGVEWPRLETDDRIGVVGCARPLEDAARIAAAGLIRWTARLMDLPLADAHQLVSQACTLRVGNLVNPVYTVAAFLPKAVLPEGAPVMGGAHDRLKRLAIRPGR